MFLRFYDCLLFCLFRIMGLFTIGILFSPESGIIVNSDGETDLALRCFTWLSEAQEFSVTKSSRLTRLVICKQFQEGLN